MNDEQPVLVTEQVFCQEGQGVLVNNASIYVVDIDSLAEDLIFTLTSRPQIGEWPTSETPTLPLLVDLNHEGFIGGNVAIFQSHLKFSEHLIFLPHIYFSANHTHQNARHHKLINKFLILWL